MHKVGLKTLIPETISQTSVTYLATAATEDPLPQVCYLCQLYIIIIIIVTDPNPYPEKKG